jgi:hypothetical protein
VRRILRTYDEGLLVDGAGAWALETRVSWAWTRDGGSSAEEIEARRKAVMERGRNQAG